MVFGPSDDSLGYFRAPLRDENPRVAIIAGRPLLMNRPGRFTIELKLQDLLAKPERTVTEKMPIVVVDPAAE